VHLLKDLNQYENWRRLLGSGQPDKRMRDIEMILRFFALKDYWKRYTKTMRDFLSNYMAEKRDISDKEAEENASIFRNTVDKVYDEIGPRVFRIVRGVNIAVFDSIMVALVEMGIDKVSDLRRRYDELLLDETYRDYASISTTDIDRVQGRIKIAIGKFSK